MSMDGERNDRLTQETKRLLKEVMEAAELIKSNSQTRRILVDKRAQHIRFEDETEDYVTIIIERKEGD
jgi:predicted oxidoreductase (fatty acid repression mutant protein)